MKGFTVILCTRVLTFLLIGQDSSAQPFGSIAGTVSDATTRRSIPGTNISLVGTALGAITDTSGGFHINNVTPGMYELRASFVGYTTNIQSIHVLPDDSSFVSIELVPETITIQPITVSATRGRLRETPATFSTLDRMNIRDHYTTQDIPVLLSELPSTTYYSDAGNGIGYTYLNIRGFDARRIAVMVNGIPQNDPEDHNVYWLDIPDIAGSLEDVQVQRGAGSAFYGSPAIGGSVNLVTSGFGREREIILSAGVGSFNSRKYSASFSSGLIDNRYALHGRLSKMLSSGYRDRSWVDFNSYFLGMIRYDENMTTQVNFYGGPISDHLAYYGIPKSDVKDRSKRRTNPILREEEVENFSQPHYEVLHEWRLSRTLTVNNTAFIILGEGFFDYDGSWAPFSYYRLTQGNGFNVTGDPDTMYFSSALIRATVSNKQFGWLPRITLRHDNGEFIAGAEVRFHRSLHWGKLQRVDMSPVSIPEDYRYYEYKGAKDIFSLYVHELYSLQSNVNIMANVQYVFNRYRLYEEGFLGTDFAVPYHFLNPRLGVNYNLDENWNTYLSLAYTSREPRLKNLYDAAEASTPASWGAIVPQFAVDANGQFNFDQPLVKPERLLDIELGAGYSSPRASTTANVYWMEFTDEIVKSGQVDRFGQPVTGNAERTRHIGIEISGLYTPVAWLEVRGNATLSRNTFVRHTDYSSGAPLSLSDNPIAGFPDVLANLRVTYRKEGLAVSVAGRYVGKQYTDNFKDEANTVDAYVVCDGWIAHTLQSVFDDVNVEAKLQVNNLFDKLYAAYGEGDRFFVGAERNVFFNLSIHL